MPVAIALVLALASCPQEPVPGDYGVVDALPAQADFELPLLVAVHASDPESCYVVEQPGTVYRVSRDPERAARTAFLDWTERVLTAHLEEGLLGFTFDPGYPKRPFVYVDYSERTEDASGKRGRRSVVSRLEVALDGEAPRVDPASELVLLTVPQPFGNHNGGTVVFGPDGMLYVALGDGGSANDPSGNGQDLTTLLGSILRIDVSEATADEPYRVPSDNPFAGRDGGVRGEIWAYGLRNPWRIAFDRATGDLWCGDVGQNQWEEVDRIVRGGNYGWNHFEGTHVFGERGNAVPAPAGLIPPVAEYGHDLGLSVTGGHVYRGDRLPELVGWYVYADYATARIWAVREDREAGAHRVVELGRASGLITSFAEELDGELLLCSTDGRIYRLVRSE